MDDEKGTTRGKGILDGLTDRSASSSDASTVLKGEDINAGATRSGTAPTPKTLGPREA